jgi:hypothetical protein|tara:strand:+ start:87 stop:404 length:318 start_codon:yes stop_codon:yes gene_type:complete
MTNGHEGLSGRSSWNVVFKVKFESDMFPGFGYDPMDIVKSLQKGIKELLPHYVESVEVSETDWDVDEDEPDQYDDDDWEITNYGIDPELGGRYGIDFDDEVGFRD